MTKRLYYEDSYITSFRSQVGVALDALPHPPTVGVELSPPVLARLQASWSTPTIPVGPS